MNLTAKTTLTQDFQAEYFPINSKYFRDFLGVS